jgi:hypothetical protein
MVSNEKRKPVILRASDEDPRRTSTTRICETFAEAIVSGSSYFPTINSLPSVIAASALAASLSRPRAKSRVPPPFPPSC